MSSWTQYGPGQSTRPFGMGRGGSSRPSYRRTSSCAATQLRSGRQSKPARSRSGLRESGPSICWRGVKGGGRTRWAGASRGLRERAAAQSERALEVFRDLSLPWDEAEAFELRARSCARFHRRGARRAFVKEGTDSAPALSQRLGAGRAPARPWLARPAAEESRLLGRRAASGAPVYPNGLSQREVEVLRLIAAGRSNKQIADELVLST